MSVGTPLQRILVPVVAAACVGGVALFWYNGDATSMWKDPGRLAAAGRNLADAQWMPVVVVGGYLLAAVLLIPVTVLIFATAYLFDPVPGFALALTGVLTSGTLGYLVGERLGAERMTKLLGRPFERARRLLSRKGFLWVALIRHIPIAPFTIVNLAVGCARVGVWQFVAGTALGMIPSIAAIMLFKHSIVAVVAGETSRATLGSYLAGIGLLLFGGYLMQRYARKELAKNE
ncbi:MAG: TVP38/TMEM64 family protein [Bdellovibrionales bacterium]|nr:TVP38/TMEM64 family protein [Bdellovibrionales bacterium]